MPQPNQFNELLATWGNISPWLFPALWGMLGLFAFLRRRYGIAVVLLLAFASDLFLSYLFIQPTFTDGGDTVRVFGTEYPKQPVYAVAALLPAVVNFSLATSLALLIHKLAKVNTRP